MVNWKQRLVMAIVLLMLAIPVMAQNRDVAKQIDIPYKKFVLKNGLTLLVHEDHKAPIVAVNVWYHVGSKNEKTNKTGFAHLFEHLMFNGSENFNDDYFQALEKIGATDLNGTTNNDRTNYFQNVPKGALDTILWLESDRMGHLVGVIDKARLDEQRGVVQNEKRQGENEPYSIADELITKNTYPAGHPYSWTVIGSMEDLNAASLDDVKEWFKTYYGAANATLVIAGDIDPETAKQKVEKYFGDIPSGPPVAHQEVDIAKRTGVTRQIAQDRVPLDRIYKVWNIPPDKMPEGDYLQMFASILGGGKNSRLYKRLVYDEQLASNASAYIDGREIAGQFYMDVTARPGVDLAKIEKAMDEELAKLIAEGPTEKELQRIKSQTVAGFIRSTERIGGFGGKSDVLASSQVFYGSPDAYKTSLQRVEQADAKTIQKTAKEWLSDGCYILEIHPFPEYGVEAKGADRTKLPSPTDDSTFNFPSLQRATLSNGLKVVLAERHDTPLVNMQLMVNAGYAADQFATPGTASLAMNMLDEGTKTRDSLQISEESALLGAQLFTGAGLDNCQVSLSSIKANLDPSLALFADVVLNPSFTDKDFERLKKRTLDNIEQEKTSPQSAAFRVLPGLLYGKGHAYSAPLTGSGTTQSVSAMKREDIVKFYKTWFAPNNATLVVAGDTTLAELTPKLEKLFQGWQKAEVPKKNIATATAPAKPIVYLVDKPGASQSVIITGQLMAPLGNPADEAAVIIMNDILGGVFTSRINLNLREDKHWSYGCFTFPFDTHGQRLFVSVSPVQTDKTKESMVEVSKELNDYVSKRPATPEEIEKNKTNELRSLPGSFETLGALLGSVARMVDYKLPDNYYQQRPNDYKNVTQAKVLEATKNVVQPDKMIWVVIGDRSKIEAGIKDLKFGDIQVIDADGNPVK